MFRNTFQKKLFSIFYSAGLDPLKDWRVHKRDGYMKRIYESDSGLLVMEMRALNSTLHYIVSPRDPKKTLGIRLPIFNLLIRNLNKCFSFEVTIMDDTRMRRRFRCANFIRCSSIQLFETTIPLTMTGCDWVLIYFNLSEFTRRSYNTSYLETERVQINGNIHLRRVFFSDRVIEYCDLPKDYQIIATEDKKPEKKIPPVGRPPSPNFRGKMQPAIGKSKSRSVSNLDVSAQQPPAGQGSMVSLAPSPKRASATMDNATVSRAPSREIRNEQTPEGQEAAQDIQPVSAETEVAAPGEADVIVKQEPNAEGPDDSQNQQEAA